MHSPSWIEWFHDNWEEPLPWYKRWFFRIVIDPIEDFYAWKYWKIDQRWQSLQNAIMRVKHGHDWVDTWNMNSWFAKNACEILEHWAEHGCGYPCGEDENGNDWTHESWKATLLEMREGFKLWNTFEYGSVELTEDELPELTDPEEIKGRDELKGGIKGLPCPNGYKSFFHEGAHYMTHDSVWHKHGLTHNERKKLKKSLSLFAEHFETLWD